MPNEKLEKLKHEQYVAERKLTVDFHAGVCCFQCVRVDHQHGAVQFSRIRNRLICISSLRADAGS